MREFFQGWKRNIGVATLMLACVFAAGWLRTFSVGEAFDMGRYVVASLDGSIVVVGPREDALSFPDWNSDEPRLAKDELKKLNEDVTGWRWCGVVCGRIDDSTEQGTSVWILPYTVIVLPLTLLTAFLLLSRPRKPAAVPSTEVV